jgi:hypothetical protein
LLASTMLHGAMRSTLSFGTRPGVQVLPCLRCRASCSDLQGRHGRAAAQECSGCNGWCCVLKGLRTHGLLEGPSRWRARHDRLRCPPSQCHRCDAVVWPRLVGALQCAGVLLPLPDGTRLVTLDCVVAVRRFCAVCFVHIFNRNAADHNELPRIFVCGVARLRCRGQSSPSLMQP